MKDQIQQKIDINPQAGIMAAKMFKIPNMEAGMNISLLSLDQKSMEKILTEAVSYGQSLQKEETLKQVIRMVKNANTGYDKYFIDKRPLLSSLNSLLQEGSPNKEEV